jgi:uncharacterized membrane protein
MSVRSSEGRAVTPRARDWAIPVALMLLAAIPVIAGGIRLADLAGGGPATADNARFFSAPLPVIVHIVGASLYCVIGAWQFSPGLRLRHPVWHRRAGRVLVVAGLAAAVSGVWMAMSYAIVPADHPLLHAFRLMAGSAMAAAIVVAFAAIRRRDVAMHRAWMVRAYAIGQGAGTQALTMLPAMLLFGPPDDLSRALLMGAAWGINLTVAEWVIRRGRAAQRLAVA